MSETVAIEAQLKAVKEDVGLLRADIAVLAGAISGDAKKLGQTQLERLAKATEGGFETATRRLREAEKSAGRTLREQPLLSAVLVFCVGILLGKLLERR